MTRTSERALLTAVKLTMDKKIAALRTELAAPIDVTAEDPDTETFFSADLHRSVTARIKAKETLANLTPVSLEYQLSRVRSTGWWTRPISHDEVYLFGPKKMIRLKQTPTGDLFNAYNPSERYAHIRQAITSVVIAR